MVYLTALESGMSPSQRVLDAPFTQNLGAAGVWEPNNYGAATGKPLVAIGGITLAAAAEVRAAGADSVALISALFRSGAGGQQPPGEIARDFLRVFR